MPDETINEKLSRYNHGMIWKLNIVENSDMMYFLMIVRYVITPETRFSEPLFSKTLNLMNKRDVTYLPIHFSA